MVTLNDKCPNCNNNLIASENTELESNFFAYYYVHCIGCNHFEEYIVWDENEFDILKDTIESNHYDIENENTWALKRIATNILKNGK